MSCRTKKVALWCDKGGLDAVFSPLTCMLVHIAFTFATLLYSQKLAAVATQGTVAGYETYMGKDSKVLFDEAAKEIKAGRENNALTCYNIIANRYNGDLTPKEALLCVKSYLKMGHICYDNANYPVAMQHFLHCQNISHRYNFKSMEAQALRFIGNVYSQFGDFEQSRILYERSLKAGKNAGDAEAQMEALVNLVQANILSGSIKTAKKYYSLLLRLPSTLAKRQYYVLFLKGVLLARDKKHVAAAHMFSLALHSARQLHLGGTYIGACRSQLAMEKVATGHSEEAMLLLSENEAMAEKEQLWDLLTSTYKEKAELYSSLGNKEKSMYYKGQYLDLYEKTFSQQAFNSLKNAQFFNELDQKVSEISQLTRQRNYQRTILWVVGACLCLLGVFVAIILKQKSGLAKAYEDLYAHNLSLINAEKEYKNKLSAMQQQIEQQADNCSKADLQTKSADEEDPRTLRLWSHIQKVMDSSNEYLDSSFTIDRLAQLVNSNPKAVSTAINKAYGQNFRTLLNKYRVKEAMLRMSDVEHYGRYTIKAISESVGYKSQSNFIAVFTKLTGIKPNIYQKLAQKQTPESLENN